MVLAVDLLEEVEELLLRNCSRVLSGLTYGVLASFPKLLRLSFLCWLLLLHDLTLNLLFFLLIIT